MLTWKTVAVATGLLVFMGGSIDRLIAIRYKSRLHLAMIRWWDRLEKTSIPDYPPLLASWILRRWNVVQKNPWRTFILYCIGSWVLISLASVLLVCDYIGTKIPIPEEIKNIKPYTWFDTVELPHVLVYSSLLPFDCLTIIATVKTLRLLKKSHVMFNLLAIVLNFLAAVILAVFCFAAVFHATEFAADHNLVGLQSAHRSDELGSIARFNYEASQSPEKYKNTILSSNTIVLSYRSEGYFKALGHSYYNLTKLVTGEATDWHEKTYVTFLDGNNRVDWAWDSHSTISRAALMMTGTVFYPTVALILILFVMIVGRALLFASRQFAMYFLDLSTESNAKGFAPATLLGVTISIVFVLLKCVMELAALFWKVI